MKAPNQVQVTLPDGMLFRTAIGDHDVIIDERGMLLVYEYEEPRNTSGIIGAYPAGHWLGVTVLPAESPK